MDVKEFARLGGKARAKKLGAEGLKAHAVKMVAARKAKREIEAPALSPEAQAEADRLWSIFGPANGNREDIDTVDNQRQPTAPDIGTTEQ